MPRWAGARLPTEAEWESAAAGLDPARRQPARRGRAGAAACRAGGRSGCARCSATCGNGPAAPICPIPGFAPAEGAVGEYNGKFMSRAVRAARRIVRHAARACRGRATATSSTRTSAGSSPASGWRRTCDAARLQTAGGRRAIRLPRRRAGGPRDAAARDPGALVLRSCRFRAVREDHRPARILSDAGPKRRCSRRIAARWRRSSGRGGRWSSSARAPRPRRRICSPRSSRPLMCRSTFRASSCANRPTALAADFPKLPIVPVEADFTQPIAPPAGIARLPKLGFFPGSTIGNMVARTAVEPAARDGRDAGRGIDAADRHGPGEDRPIC